MSHKYNNPVISALDDIASELEKTGNADLASLVDEVAAEVLIPAKPVMAKAKSVAKPAAKPFAKSAKRVESSVGARRSRIASAMRKIARAQVSELEDIAQELMKEGDKRAALEVLKIAEDLDSEYEYSGVGKHKAPASKGDASKLFNKNKANKPDAKMSAEEKKKLETPFGSSDAGYPLNASRKKKSKDANFDRTLAQLMRLASEEDMDLDTALPPEEDMDLPSEEAADDDMAEGADADEDADDADLDGLEGLDEEDSEEDDLDDLDMGEDADLDAPEADEDGEDELAAMMKAMGDDEDEDVDASSDRQYDADAAEDPFGETDSDEEEPAFGGEPDGDEPEDDEDDEDDEEEENELDEPEDEEASMMGGLQGGAAGASIGSLAGPIGTAVGGLAGGAIGALTADKKKLMALAQKLASRGEKGLAARVARLAKK